PNFYVGLHPTLTSSPRSGDLRVAYRNRRFKVHKGRQQLIRAHSETLFVVAVCTRNPDFVRRRSELPGSTNHFGSITILVNAVRASGATVVGEPAVANHPLRTMVRTGRPRCIRREYPQALTRL